MLIKLHSSVRLVMNLKRDLVTVFKTSETDVYAMISYEVK